MSRIIYLTWGEPWSPVLQGQVGDVVDLLGELHPDPPPELVCGVSLRNFPRGRRSVKNAARTALVLPMFPGNRNWARNCCTLAILFRFKRPGAVICRGPVATALAIRARESTGLDFKICYDGRGARSAEIEEYAPDDPLASEMKEIEGLAVNQSDWRVAVSNALVTYWRDRFAYSGNGHTVIPCSLARHFESESAGTGNEVRVSFKWAPEDVIIAHVGGGAGWQHGSGTFKALEYWLKVHQNLRLLILSKPTGEFDDLAKAFPHRIAVTQVPHHKVSTILSACDYGLIIREASVTNRVASPVKFAEYLACGLRVLISPELGDFSSMVREGDLGHVVSDGRASGIVLNRTRSDEKARIRSFGIDRFSKGRPFIQERYHSVVDSLLSRGG